MLIILNNEKRLFPFYCENIEKRFIIFYPEGGGGLWKPWKEVHSYFTQGGCKNHKKRLFPLHISEYGLKNEKIWFGKGIRKRPSSNSFFLYSTFANNISQIIVKDTILDDEFDQSIKKQWYIIIIHFKNWIYWTYLYLLVKW